MGNKWPDLVPAGTYTNDDVATVEQRTEFAFGRECRFYVVSMKDGTEWRLRSVTTCLDCLNKEALIQWAVDLACEDVRLAAAEHLEREGVVSWSSGGLDAVLKRARLAHKRTKEEAAALGTRAHDLIEQFLRSGIQPNLADEDPRVQNCLTLFYQWWEGEQLTVLNTELLAFDVASGYGGQVDFLAGDRQGRPVLVDWKTSKSIYWNYRLQVVAYAKALQLSGYGIPSRIVIVRIGKDDPDFQALEIPRNEWRDLLRLFHNCIPLSDAMKAAEAEYKRAVAARKKAAEAERQRALAAQQKGAA